MTDEITDRLGLEVLSADECWELLRSAPVGRIAFVEAGDPVILPVTYGIHGRSIVFRSSGGAKLGAAAMARAAAFEIDDWDAEAHTGWSVLVKGVCDNVIDEDGIADLADAEVAPWLDAAATGEWIVLRAEEISGRRLS